MTVLIAQNTKDKIILAADTGLFRFSSQIHCSNHKMQYKILTVNDITFSSCGRYAEQINFGIFCLIRKPESANILGIQRFFIDFGKWLREQCLSERGDLQNNYFFVFDKKLFHFQDAGIQEILEDDYATDGAGYKEAYMAMYLGKSPKEAIDLTVQMNVWTSGEAQIVQINK